MHMQAADTSRRRLSVLAQAALLALAAASTPVTAEERWRWWRWREAEGLFPWTHTRTPRAAAMGKIRRSLAIFNWSVESRSVDNWS